MRILLAIALGVISALAFVGLCLWLTWFVMDLDIEIESPIDVIEDHAERTADIVNEILKRKREK